MEASHGVGGHGVTTGNAFQHALHDGLEVFDAVAQWSYTDFESAHRGIEVVAHAAGSD